MQQAEASTKFVFQCYDMLQVKPPNNYNFFHYDDSIAEKIINRIMENQKVVFCFIKKNSNMCIEWLQGFTAMCYANPDVHFYVFDVSENEGAYSKFKFTFTPHFIVCRKMKDMMVEKPVDCFNMDNLEIIIKKFE